MWSGYDRTEPTAKNILSKLSLKFKASKQLLVAATENFEIATPVNSSNYFSRIKDY